MKLTLPRKLRDAAERPDNWDVPGLLRDAATALEIARANCRNVNTQLRSHLVNASPFGASVVDCLDEVIERIERDE